MKRCTSAAARGSRRAHMDSCSVWMPKQGTCSGASARGKDHRRRRQPAEPHSRCDSGAMGRGGRLHGAGRTLRKRDRASGPPARTTAMNNAIYVGTGNSQYPHTAQPDELYGSGLISLDAETGAFRVVHPTRSRRQLLGWRHRYRRARLAERVLDRAHGASSRSGARTAPSSSSTPANLSVVARRQLLPRTGGTGLPGDRGAGIPAVVPTGGERREQLRRLRRSRGRLREPPALRRPRRLQRDGA